jgi:hypothetical protein
MSTAQTCDFLVMKNEKTNSVYCCKLDQWISAKFCLFCREKLNDNNKINSLHSYSYNYSIGNNNNAGKRGKTSPLLKNSLLLFPEG